MREMRDKRKAIEILAIWDNPDGTQTVQTGIYLFSTSSLADVHKLLKCYEERCEKCPDRFEVAMKEFEEDDADE